MYNEDLGAYILSEDQYNQLLALGLDGYEDQGFDDVLNGYIVIIYGDDILEALNLGPYSGGSIIINPSHQGGPM